jgi:hypothetical protein
MERIEDDKSGVVVGTDGVFELVGMVREAEREDVLRVRRIDAVEDGNAEQVRAGGGEAIVEGGVVLGSGKEDAGGGDVAGGEAADSRGGKVGSWGGGNGVGVASAEFRVQREELKTRRGGGGGELGGRVVGPGVRDGEACGKVDGEEGFAGGGVADEEGEAAEGEALGPEPVEAWSGVLIEEAEGGGGGTGAVVVRVAAHDTHNARCRRQNAEGRRDWGIWAEVR